MLSIGLRLLELFVALSISKAFDRVWRVVLLHKLNSHGIAGMYFLSNWQLQMVLDGKSSEEIKLMLKFLIAPFLGLHFSYCK